MAKAEAGSVRAIALVGAAGTGKTTLLEAMMFASGEIPRQGQVESGSSVGDSSPEARRRGGSVEMNLAGFTFLDDRYSIVDCPGSMEFAGAGDWALPAVDLALVVVDPHEGRAALAQPIFKALERLEVPHAIFVNKIDEARGPIDALLAELAPVSAAPLVARQIPLIENEHVTGFVDLALERAFVYRTGQPSEQIDLPAQIAGLEADARFHMLEQLADHDDELMEQLLTDVVPSRDAVFADLVAEMQRREIVPVFFGSALNGYGVRRLLKAFRHETPDVSATAERLGLSGPCAYVFGSSFSGGAGKLAQARVMAGALHDGEELTMGSGERARAGGLFAIKGATTRKIAEAKAGDVVAIAKIEKARPGDVLSLNGKAQEATLKPGERRAVFSLAIEARHRKDDVRLSGALGKLLEEDPTLRLDPSGETQELILSGQGEAHLAVTVERLQNRFTVEVTTTRPKVSYQETIKKPVTQRGRHKKQTGGHGQFGDVVVEIKPMPRGSGVTFSQRVTGGVVPKQWIPAVEQGVRDACERGPLGFRVTDVDVVLIDGSHHSVDSSEMAFRQAGRLAMSEGLKVCNPTLLEPIEQLTIVAPSSSTSKIAAAVSSKRGHVQGFAPRDGWRGWDEIRVLLPQYERQELIAELRGLTQGLGLFTAVFDHMTEVGGRLAEDIIQREKAHA
ncbi:MAG: elongation factor G [Caulobacterales bacterium]